MSKQCFGKYDPFCEECRMCEDVAECFDEQPLENAQKCAGKCTCSGEIDNGCPIHGDVRGEV